MNMTMFISGVIVGGFCTWLVIAIGKWRKERVAPKELEAVIKAHKENARAFAEAQKSNWKQRPRPPYMNLCKCETFDRSPQRNPHGYCMYCGGWEPKTFRKYMGEEALQNAISDLDIHGRERMRSIVSLH